MVEEEPATNANGGKRRERTKKKTKRDSIQNVEICNVDKKERERERETELVGSVCFSSDMSLCVCICVRLCVHVCMCACAWPGLHLPLYQDAQTKETLVLSSLLLQTRTRQTKICCLSFDVYY